MEDLVLVSKVNGAAGLSSLRAGRPARTNFCLRGYEKFHLLGLPNGTCGDGDRIDFLMSASGFAVRIGPNGERSISKNRTGRSAMVPKNIVNHIPNLTSGKTELVSEEHPDRTWYFPFSQFFQHEP